MIHTDGMPTIACATVPPRPYDLVGNIIAFEQGELDEPDTIELFQRLIDNGSVWSLQGFYGRTAVALIDAGLCNPR